MPPPTRAATATPTGVRPRDEPLGWLPTARLGRTMRSSSGAWIRSRPCARRCTSDVVRSRARGRGRCSGGCRSRCTAQLTRSTGASSLSIARKPTAARGCRRARLARVRDGGRASRRSTPAAPTSAAAAPRSTKELGGGGSARLERFEAGEVVSSMPRRSPSTSGPAGAWLWPSWSPCSAAEADERRCVLSSRLELLQDAAPYVALIVLRGGRRRPRRCRPRRGPR